MDTIFMNSENSKTSHPHKLLLNVSHKIDLKSSGKYVALSNISILYMKKILKSHTEKSISDPTWKKIDLPYRLYSVSDI